MSFMGAVMEGIFTVPGDGAIDYGALLRLLAEGGYAGWLVVEAEQDLGQGASADLCYAGLSHLTRLGRGGGVRGRWKRGGLTSGEETARIERPRIRPWG